MAGDLDSRIFERETERQKIQAENKTRRIIAICIAFTVSVAIASIFGLWAYTVHVPDAAEISPGTKIDCVVEEKRGG